MAQIKRTLRKQVWRVLDRYARSRSANRRTLSRIRPLLSLWFAVADRVR